MVPDQGATARSVCSSQVHTDTFNEVDFVKAQSMGVNVNQTFRYAAKLYCVQGKTYITELSAKHASHVAARNTSKEKEK